MTSKCGKNKKVAHEAKLFSFRKPAFVHFCALEKKPFDVICCLYKMQQSHWLLCVAKTCDWSRKITPLSNLTQKSLLVEWKLTTKAELNCKIYKYCRKYWETQVSFCHQSSPVSRKAWKLPRKLQELKNYARKTCACGQPGGHLIRVLKERSVINGGNLCPLWFVILKSV